MTKTSWMPRLRWILLVTAGLALSSTLQASRMMALADRPPAVIPVGRLLVLNITLWLVPALLPRRSSGWSTCSLAATRGGPAR